MLHILALQQEPNPVGEVKEVQAIEEQLNSLADQWDAQIVELAGWKSWLMPWKWGQKVSLFKVTDFLLKALDSLINIVDEHLDNGPDKKATVLKAVDRLYDYVIREAIPIILRPLAGVIKNYVIYTLISASIDWIVAKYKNGAWRDKIKVAEQA